MTIQARLHFTLAAVLLATATLTTNSQTWESILKLDSAALVAGIGSEGNEAIMIDPASVTAGPVHSMAGSTGLAENLDNGSLWPPQTFFSTQAEETLELPLPAKPVALNSSVARQPLAFERNDGQTDSEARFISRGRGYTLFLANNETVLKLVEPPIRIADSPLGVPGRLENRRFDVGTHDFPAGERRKDSPAGVLRMRLSGANPQPSIGGEECLRAKVNYFIGNQPSLWRTNIPTFGKVRYREVYPGIDLVYYGNKGQLEYDFVVAPGADPNRIAMEFEGADDVRTDERGDLVLKVGERELRWHKPFIYQEVNGVRHEIVGMYRLGTGESDANASGSKVQRLRFVSFVLAAYDPGLPLVIDPRLVFSTYLGGAGEDTGRAVAVDGQGNVYVAGGTASVDFPTKAALNPTAAGGANEIFVAKFNPASELLFSTYLGGSGNDFRVQHVDIAVNPAGECHVVGATDSHDFPLVNPLQEWYGGGDFDAFVTVLKADGSAILFSTYLGGEDRDEARAVEFGPTGDSYVVGVTKSPGFPTQNAFQPQLSPMSNGEQLSDGFITRLEAGGRSIVYSTFYGQSVNAEFVWDVAVDGDGNAYLAIWASSYFDGLTQWLITRISPDGSSRLFERRWPAAMSQPIMLFPKIALAPNGRVVVAGSVNVPNLPALNKPNPSMTLGYSEVYLALFNATNGSYLSAVYFGGGGNESVDGVSMDVAGDIIVTGWTAGLDSQASGFPVTDPLESGPDPGKSVDIYVAKFRPTGLSLTFSTLIGGPTNDYTGGLALDSGGNPWITGYTTGQFPMVNAFQPEPGGGNEAFLVKLSFGERIRISRTGQSVTLSWPVQATNFVLEAATTLPAISWDTVTNNPTVGPSERSVELPLTGNAKFFRLRSP